MDVGGQLRGFQEVRALTEPGRLWHVTVTVAGDQVDPVVVQDALCRLNHQRPFLHSLKYAPARAEFQYWEEAESLLDASSLALRVWNEHRRSEELPHWEVIGLEVLERSIFLGRGLEFNLVHLPDVTPVPF